MYDMNVTLICDVMKHYIKITEIMQLHAFLFFFLEKIKGFNIKS